MRPEGAGSETVDSASLWSALRRSVLLVIGLTVAGLALRGFGGAVDVSVLDRLGVGRGVLGDVAFVLLGAAACAAGVPRQAVAFAASYAFGLWAGAVLALVAQVAGCLASFGWARALGRAWAERRLRGRLARADRFLAANPFTATLVIRLIPVGSSLALSLMAGLSSVPLLPFLAASALGFIPQTVIFSLLGGGARIAHGAQIGIAAGLFLGSVLAGVWLLRRQRQLASLALDSEEPSFA